jgi:hypothetical protein
MFKKIHILVFTLLMFALFNANITQAQPTKTVTDVYPVVSIAPIGGVQFPVSGLNDLYNASWNAGLDIGLKINRETSFYINGTFFNMPIKTELPPGPNASYIAIVAGPRYIFSSKSIKAQIFVEAGVGAYIFTMNEWTTSTTPAVVIPSESKVSFGVNVGPGVIIPLGKSFDLLFKTKLHYTFQTGGSHTFVAINMGLDFKL